MTIRRGEAWGETVPRPPGLAVLDSDAALADAVAGDPAGAWGLSGGDLFQSVGAPPVRDPVQRLPLDALVVTTDTGERLAVAHVVARDPRWHGWRGHLVGVMNVDRYGAWIAAPRAHPGDGRFDVVEISPDMTLRARFQARGRAAHGGHVPHPDIHVRVAVEDTWQFAHPKEVFADGRPVGVTSRLTVRVLPDHFAIHV